MIVLEIASAPLDHVDAAADVVDFEIVANDDWMHVLNDLVLGVDSVGVAAAIGYDYDEGDQMMIAAGSKRSDYQHR